MKGLLRTTFLAGPLQRADISFTMEEGGKELLTHMGKRALIPASNMKLVYSALALLLKNDKALFPPLQTFCDAKIENGILAGNLLIDSCGTPTFTARFPVSDDFPTKNQLLKKQVISYVDQLKKAGIKEILGDIKLSFNRWNAEAENLHYTAASAFSFNENTVDTLVKNGQLTTIPAKPLIFLFAENKEIQSQDKVENNLIRFNPTNNSQDYWRISKSSANSYALKMIRQEIQNLGIKIHGKEIKAGKQKMLFESQPLFSSVEYIQPLNKHSDNFRAEILALLLNRLETNEASYENLDESIKKLLLKNGLELKSLKAHDGSGLSRENRISAFDINQVLKLMMKSNFFKDYLNSLAIASKTGTLKKRFKGSPWENSFYGKTGTLDGVSALSGYWIRKNKPTVTFSFIGNNA